ncbi:MAG: hypothetical protein ABL872_04900 [Lacibacter sp.]
MIRTKRQYIRLSLTHAFESSVHSWLLQPNRNRMPNSYVIDFIHKRPDSIHT